MPGTREMMNSASAIVGGMPEIAADGGDGAVDVDRQRPALGVGKVVQHQFHGANHADVIRLDFELQRHLEEPGGARVAGVEAMAEARAASRARPGSS